MARRILNKKTVTKMDNSMLMHYEFTDINATLASVHGKKFTDYREEWDRASSLEYTPKRPLYVVLETNSYCNMKCKMCVRNFDESKTRKEDVDIAQFRKIIHECHELGVPSFFIGAEAECLINPNIKEILRIVKEEGGGIDNFVITNGYELNEDICNLLIDLQWERVYVSLDAATQETYKTIRGRDLNVVERNIERLLELREKRNSILPLVRVSFVIQDENCAEQEAFLEKWKDKVDVIDYQTCLDYSHMGELRHNLPPIEYHCNSPFRQILIDVQGNINPCCTEWGYKMPIGNIRNMSINEAWNSKAEQRLRTSMMGGGYKHYLSKLRRKYAPVA